MILYSFLGVIGFVILAAIIFINFYPSFGGKVEGARLVRAQKAPNHTGERFTNLGEVKEDFTWADYKKMTAKMLKGNPNKKPNDSLPSITWKKEEVENISDSTTTAIWYGHSAFYLKMNGMNILLDPMFGDYPAPAPYLINKRFNYKLPIEIEDLPEIDIIVFSHDHFDHLDYGSVLKLKEKTKMFLTPLGLGAHLERWGVPPEKIQEFYWHEGTEIGGIKFTCTPSQHFSGRGTSDKMHTLWASWVIEGDQKLFFSGDSGYFPGFKEIGDKYGPFDFSFMECGQYDPLWHDIHMMPEETAQAALDLRSKRFMPIHWAGFTLSVHDWDDPAKRVTQKAEELGLDIIIPQIGRAITIEDSTAVYENDWWRSID